MAELNPQQLDLRDRIRDLAVREIAPRAAEVDRTEEYPWDNVEKLTKAGFMGMTIPEAYGGKGASYMDTVLLVEEMAKVCGVTGRICVEGNMGAIGAVMKYGSDEQRKIAAELVLSGDKPAICITEPNAGSAATDMSTRADKKGEVYVLNGKKHWITGAGVSKLHLIFARVFEDGEEQGIGGFLAIRGETKGLSIGNREPAMGLRGIPEAEIIMEDMEVPASMMITPPEGIRRGFAGLMNAYNTQRVGAATVALGIAQGAYELALGYSQTREQFGRPIYEFQGLHWMLADMSIQLEAARGLVYSAATSAESTQIGFPDPLMAAQCKVFTADMAIKVANDALQVYGAMGYSRNLPLERMARDARMFTIGGGTAQVLRTLVASKILDAKLPQTRDGFTKLAAAKAATKVGTE
ncbi:MAG: acyl-CoA dehydrogenase [Rhodospirillaceae bacterium]|nr:acyl-CoA dehydrogenase [Rhodospirillaceae bacterium]MBT3909240.1 acyl-CoA dehydrogenase [Rhodospirillaceae bacterium]MBT5297518.1 acyl-CoA dehydrogenase [Rhodospirillaceae bacterium]MBT5515223.1 acyl-CoA dehydrogenase [Rhodospirillaceae bacterium]MBT6086391.1 acyl-CoA dehydrogenase [Rhodospirillaceae bacterium]